MKRHSRQYGAAIIEFAIVLMPMITILFGITEFGRAVYQYNTVAKAVRDAARYLTYQTPGDTTAIAVAKCMVKYGAYSSCNSNSSYSGELLAPGLASATITICDQTSCSSNQAQGSNPVIDLVTVTVSNYQFSSLFMPFFQSIAKVNFGSTITYDNISTTMRTQL